MMDHQVEEASPLPKKRKQPRAVLACERCRMKKYRCDEDFPNCSQCKKARASCTYSRVTRTVDREEDSRDSIIRDLEKKLENLTALKTLCTSRTPESSQMSVAWPPPVKMAAPTGIIPVSTDSIRPGSASAPMGDLPSEGPSPGDSEITDLNQHTQEIQFHGNTSSMAFIDSLRKLSCPDPVASNSPTELSLVSALHNSAFSNLYRTPTSTSREATADEPNFYFTEAHLFIEAYFSGIHFIHPFIDRSSFMSQAEALWSGRNPKPSSTFIPTYFGLLATGVLMMHWTEYRLGGRTRFEWSRMLFKYALHYLDKQPFSNDLNTIHCLYFLTKVCQNELNPHLAWMYLGRAIRTCISAGFNRNIRSPQPIPAPQLSKTWCLVYTKFKRGLYSLEIETSFSLGRADTLGLDEFHNCPLPERDDTESVIIPCMVDFSRIIRRVSIFYTTKLSYRVENIELAYQLENDMNTWLTSLPTWIRPGSQESRSANSLREPEWCRRHRLVLEIRFHNVKMALFRGFLDQYSFQKDECNKTELSTLLHCIDKCIDSARRTIELMHETFRVHAFFRTWWYNTTYIMMAAAAVLSYIQRVRTDVPHSLVRLVEMAVEILDAMDESHVSQKCAEILKRHLSEVNSQLKVVRMLASATDSSGTNQSPPGISQIDLEGAPSTAYEIVDYSFEDMAALFQDLQDMALPNLHTV